MHLCTRLTAQQPSSAYASSSWGFPNNIQWHTTVGRTLWTRDRPVAETSTRQNTTLTREKTSTPSARFEPANPPNDRSQTLALDRSAIAIGSCSYSNLFTGSATVGRQTTTRTQYKMPVVSGDQYKGYRPPYRNANCSVVRFKQQKKEYGFF